METKQILRQETSVAQITANFNNAIAIMNTIINENDYHLAIKGMPNFQIEGIKLDFSNTTKSGRKKLAKRIHFFDKKRTLKSMNSLFSVFRRFGVISETIKISISGKEKEINRLRNIYKIMRAKTEEARLAYKKEKGNFYKEKLV